MEVLLLGGSEFVGKAYLENLISKGFIVDFITRGIKPITTKGFRNHFKCDRRDEKTLKEQIKDYTYDYVFDISAYTVDDIKPILNIINRSNLKRYFLLSTGGVYTPSTFLITENDEIGYNSNWGDYGLNKKKVEELLLDEFKVRNLPILIFRPTYIYGEGNNLYRETYFFQRIKDHLPIPYPDTNKGKTQFIYIKDLVNITIEAVKNDLTNGEEFNITNPEIYTWKELIQILEEVTKTEVIMVPIPQQTLNELNISSKEFFPFRDITYLLSVQKLVDFGLPIPKISLNAGLEESFKWFNSQKIEQYYELFKSLDKLIK